MADHRPAPGVVPYVVSTPGWTDGAVAERLVALPGDSCIQRISASQWEFPEGAVLVQTLSLPQHRGDRDTGRRIETRLLTKQTGVWAGYSYVWNDAQDDATLAPSEGDGNSTALGYCFVKRRAVRAADVASSQSHGLHVVPQPGGQFRPGIE